MDKTIEERARKYATQRVGGEYVGGFKGDMWEALYQTYIEIATEQHKIDIDKSCEWLQENVNNYLYNTGGFEEYIPQCGGAMFINFRKAMEG